MTGSASGQPDVRPSTVAVTALAPLAWGLTYFVTAELLPPGRPLLAGTVRALPTGVLLVAMSRRWPHGIWRARIAVLGACNFGVFFALLFVGAYRLPGGVAATIGAVQPLLVAGLAAGLLRERVGWRTIAAAVLGLTGVALLVLRADAALDAVGVLAALGAAGSFGLGNVLVERWGRPAPLIVFAGWQLLAGGLLLAPLTLLIEGLPDGLTARNVAGYAYLMSAGAAISYPIWLRGIERIGASAATFLSLEVPVVATLVGVLARHEHLTPWQGVGIVAVLASIVAGQAARRVERLTREPHPVVPVAVTTDPA